MEHKNISEIVESPEFKEFLKKKEESDMKPLNEVITFDHAFNGTLLHGKSNIGDLIQEFLNLDKI